ncbi:hypothetical protein [Burkholderia sp. S-53]|uniref:hypothetical protein n=1 Tax=Burkholderia sp. S-53 TaxID=2906514 RepID=UPI0021D3BCA3|nr:hypothetical protein [Burkholderia sp. S-53]UXU91352.1 hypothetical protein LXM88_24600 [Burkholderia sp. S-53]
MSTQAAPSQKDLVRATEQEAKDALAGSDWRPYDGIRVKSSQSPNVYLVINGTLHFIPDPDTYFNLFPSWEGIFVDDYLTSHIPQSLPLSVGAWLIRGDSSSLRYLLTNGQKRAIRDDIIFRKFDFDPGKVKVIPEAVINSLPTGEDVE